MKYQFHHHQHDAFHKRKGCPIQVRKQARGNSCRGEMMLTPKQWIRYQNAANGESTTLPFEHKHLVENMKHQGGFLPLIAAAIIFSHLLIFGAASMIR